jgi:hypothetical protein
MTFQQPAAGQFKPPLEGVAARWATEVVALVKHASANAPRSLQHAVGPSEIGTPCDRRLGYRLLAWPPVNVDTDPWASTVGTAIHAYLADVYTQRNAELGRGRYLIEQTVTLPGGITGHCDLYDTDTGDVVDWKTTGTDALAKYRKNGPGQQYRVQAHLYGLGWQLAGQTPRNVVVVFLPRGGRIDGLHVWSEPYDHRIAVDALKRYQAIFDFHVYVDPESHPDRWSLLDTADAYCAYCPWFLPGSPDLSKGCPGHPK